MRDTLSVTSGRGHTVKASYSASVKERLCARTAFEVGLEAVAPDAFSKRCEKCCALAFFYGVTLFSRRLERETMTLSIENEALLEICTYVMIHYFLAQPEVRQTERSGKKRFEVSFGRDLVGYELFEKLRDEEKDFAFALECESCKKYFLRGAFLSAGTISDPKSDYRIEFLLKDMKNAEALADFIGSEFSPRISKRRSDCVVYIKGNERTESFCTFIGAESVTLDIIEKSIEKETMNALNRSCNCEHANMKRTVNASVQIRQAIKKLRDSGKFATLSDDLKLTAELREQYPEASLSQLATMTEGGISRSGINHRLKKLIELSEE
ncbi:MAG: DNA-binding protein WhiA [Clostridia bacterium]|nr:DNA-binding protein WhiA [Clostridia bacterium]